MKPKDYLQTVHFIEKLKDVTRHCYTIKGRHESVAEHSWAITLMAYLLQDEFPEVDINKVIKMCLIHDLGEIFTGDIPTFIKTEGDSKKEEELLNEWVASLDEPFRSEFGELYEEMEALKTPEARLYKSMDKLEALIQHNESDISTWSQNEFTLNLNYAWDNVAFSEYLKQLRQEIKDETQAKIRDELVIYFDMDGVLADFDKGTLELLGIVPMKQEEATREHNNRLFGAMRDYHDFYLYLDPIQANVDLMLELKKKGYHVEILTGVPSLHRGIDEAGDNKRQWVREYMGEDVIINAVYRADKTNFCKGKNCILIDDYSANTIAWQKAGGTAILYTDSEKLREDLRVYGIEC